MTRHAPSLQDGGRSSTTASKVASPILWFLTFEKLPHLCAPDRRMASLSDKVHSSKSPNTGAMALLFTSSASVSACAVAMSWTPWFPTAAAALAALLSLNSSTTMAAGVTLHRTSTMAVCKDLPPPAG